jgi:hypothetical protein
LRFPVLNSGRLEWPIDLATELKREPGTEELAKREEWVRKRKDVEEREQQRRREVGGDVCSASHAAVIIHRLLMAIERH